MAKTNVTPEATTEEKVTVEATEATLEKEKAPVKKSNGNGSYGKRGVKLADMPPVSLTQAAFDKLDAAGIVAALIDPKNSAINRISRERAKAMLIARFAAGRIKCTPVTLADLTYKNVVVTGVELPEKVRGVSEPKVTLTQDQFDKLTPAGVAAYVEKYTHKRRIADVIIPDYILAGMPMTAEDVVSITNGRVAVKGVVIQRAGNAPAHAIVDGVEFG